MTHDNVVLLDPRRDWKKHQELKRKVDDARVKVVNALGAFAHLERVASRWLDKLRATIARKHVRMFAFPGYNGHEFDPGIDPIEVFYFELTSHGGEIDRKLSAGDVLTSREKMIISAVNDHVSDIIAALEEHLVELKQLVGDIMHQRKIILGPDSSVRTHAEDAAASDMHFIQMDLLPFYAHYVRLMR